jgi:hypothetical protein
VFDRSRQNSNIVLIDLRNSPPLRAAAVTVTEGRFGDPQVFLSPYRFVLTRLRRRAQRRCAGGGTTGARTECRCPFADPVSSGPYQHRAAVPPPLQPRPLGATQLTSVGPPARQRSDWR